MIHRHFGADTLREKRKCRPHLCLSLEGCGTILQLHNQKQAMPMPIAEAQSGLTPAEDNPWYLLATLYGVPDVGVPGWIDDERQAQNRVAWNRYHASQWTAEERERLKDRVTGEELRPFDEQELAQLRQKFVDRAGEWSINMPAPDLAIGFRSCHFNDAVCFNGYAFVSVDFSSATFSRDADFSNATFSGYADFSSATFSGDVDFSSATFPEYADFNSATFSGDVDFSSATISGYADFSSAAFGHKVVFTNAEMKAPTYFEGCRFEGRPPMFPGAKLHEGTVWREVSWPRPPVDPGEAGAFTDAYERLKLEMDRLKKHEDELMFFSKELECRRVAAGQFRGLPIGIYGVLCHYGQSYLRPLGWLLALILVGAVQFWPVLGWDFLLSLGVSTANTLGPLGLRKELIEPGTLPELSRWLRFLSGAQMVVGLILLFLIGLGLRNRFRMK